MPADARTQVEAERRIGAVRAVEQVMRAVWALARAQLPLAEAAAAEAATYVAWAEALVDRLAGAPGPATDGDPLVVLVGPERAFCGPLARVLLGALPPSGRVGLVGARLAQAGTEDDSVASRIAFTLPACSTPDELGPAADRVAHAILQAGLAHGVVMLHPIDGTSAVTRSVLIAGAREPVDEPLESFGAPRAVLEAAVLEAVGGRLAAALAEALRSEVRARLAAADAARRACERQLDELNHQWRTLRQATITQELLEIVAARSAIDQP